MDCRKEMEQDTQCAILSCKLNCDSECYKLETPKELLKAAKASIDYNNTHKSS